MTQELATLEKSIKTLQETIRSEEEEGDQIGVKFKNLLNDTIQCVFLEWAEEVPKLLDKLYKGKFNDGSEQESLILGNERYLDDVVNELVGMGIVGYQKDDDMQLKLYVVFYLYCICQWLLYTNTR